MKKRRKYKAKYRIQWDGTYSCVWHISPEEWEDGQWVDGEEFFSSFVAAQKYLIKSAKSRRDDWAHTYRNLKRVLKEYQNEKTRTA